MRVAPDAQVGSASWTHENAAMIAVGVWTEKKPGRGEDCEPLFLAERTTQRGVVAVCDGVGGAGGQTVGRTADGTERSGAWMSSRAVRLAVEQYFVRSVHGSPAAQAEGLSLHASVSAVLQQLRNPARSRIGGTMPRELPSTLAAIFYRYEAGSLRCHVRWAGDSRCYVLSGAGGLQQLSRDDTEDPDALSSLEQDPPMTNRIAADGHYRIHDESAGADTPCILLCATDGFFNYVQTPAHFEYFLLATLNESANAAAWGSCLARQVQGYTQDDASLALVALGYRDFDELRATFGARLEFLTTAHWQPFQNLDQSDATAFREARLESWRRYRDDYERRILHPAEDRR
jgi:serine/threonine protein phosphatase PrpC